MWKAKGIVLFLLLCVLPTTGQVLPKPQVPASANKPAADFTLKDQQGKNFHLASLHGSRVLLLFYRGYWWPYCIAQLREFARHSEDFNSLHTRVLAISTDDQQQALLVWEKTLNREFTVLSDPGARVIRSYGLIHANAGKAGEDIALDTIVFVDTDSVERWRQVAETLTGLPTAEEALRRIRETSPRSSPSKK